MPERRANDGSPLAALGPATSFLSQRGVHVRPFIVLVIAVFSYAVPACADNSAPDADFLVKTQSRDPWRVDWAAIASTTTPTVDALVITATPTVRSITIGDVPARLQDTQPLHAAAFQHSDAYQTRAKIHTYASWATLPLFAGEIALGQSLFNQSTPAGSKRGLHAAIGAGIIGLFGLNTVTGSWNLFGEGWQEKDGRTLRLVHGLLMMAADAGFVGTWATGPHSGRLRTALTFEHDKMVHRNIAYASIGVGTASYLIMFIANHH
jgi:hypothetical protein